MEGTRGTCLYREARLNIEPAFPGSTISLTLPADANSTFGTRAYPKRIVVNESSSDRTADAFATRHLASDGGMFFRRRHRYPRSFLWRILDSRKTLEIQSVDLSHDANDKLEANMTILLHFASPIRPFCLAFAEPEDHDALTIFAITSANELYTITLPRDFFLRPAASEQEMGDWCKHSTPNQLTTRTPYRLAASTNEELLVSLDDGGILVLKKTNKDDAFWEEALYQHLSWSVRGFLSWKTEQKVRFDNGDLAVSAAAAVALSPDKKHIFSVCLDHKLRAWNVATGKSGVQTDLLSAPDRPNEKTAPYLIGPSQPSLMAIVPVHGGIDGAHYYVATYSPKQHQFKFWGIRDADESGMGIFDYRSDFDFIPPVDDLMETTAWTLAEFFIIPGPAGWRGTELWIRARSGPSSRIYTIKFDPDEEPAKLAKAWKDGWVCLDQGPLSIEQLKHNPSNPGELDLDSSDLFETDVSERWLEFIFYPGRFTTATLEAALLVFQRGLSRQATQSSSRGSLKERICATVVAFTVLRKDGDVDQDQFQEIAAAQWQAFYSLVKDLHKRRGEYLSLAFDPEHHMPWLVLSDYLSAIRQCSDLETIALNSTAITGSERLVGPLMQVVAKPEVRDASRLLLAARSFRKCLPTSVHSQLQREVETELLQGRSLSLIDRMELMDTNCQLSQQVSDDDLSLLVEELGIRVKDITMETFFRACSLTIVEEQGEGAERRQITRYGLSGLVRVSQETLELNLNVLLDLLVLILFMQWEEDLSEDFDASEIFNEIINQLKDYTMLSWLAGTVWSHQAPYGPSSETLQKSLSENSKNPKQLPITQTVLEGFLGHRAFELSMPQGLKPELLTYWARAWLTLPFDNRSYPGVVEEIMGVLLMQEEYRLASEFSKFLHEGNWATYLKGRMHLALGDHTLASICFQKAAYHLSLENFSLEDSDPINYISAEQRDSFSNGLGRYYSHILSLFEKCKAYTFVADFAHLGLRCLRGKKDEELRTELLSRLFNSSIQTARFDDAYSAMTRHTDSALQSAALNTLLTTMISASQTPHFLSYPFTGLAHYVDATLAAHAHKTLNLASPGPQYHHILYAHRIARSNFRGAAEIMHDRLQRLRATPHAARHDAAVAECYLLIINALESVGEPDRYLLAEKRLDVVMGASAGVGFGIGVGKALRGREIYTLERLRREFAGELDRVERVERGAYPFVEVGGGEEMDIL